MFLYVVMIHGACYVSAVGTAWLSLDSLPKSAQALRISRKILKNLTNIITLGRGLEGYKFKLVVGPT